MRVAGEGPRAVTQDMLLPPALPAQGRHVRLSPGRNSNTEDDGGNHEVTRLPLRARLSVTPKSSPVAPGACGPESRHPGGRSDFFKV